MTAWHHGRVADLRALPLLVCAALALAACSPPKPTDIQGPEIAWDEMDHAARQAYMASEVLPHMRERFQAFDSERYAEFTCATCHPTGVETGDYAMPDPGIPPLSRWNFRKEHWKAQPEMVQFMWEEVKPRTSALLGGPKGKRGFNCDDCHTRR